MNETFDSIHEWYQEYQLLVTHLPIGTQLEILGTAYELETGQISRTEALTMGVYYSAIMFTHLYMGIVAVEHMQRVQGLHANIPAPLARKIEKIAFGSTLRLATRLMMPFTIYETYKVARQLFTPGATSYTRIHYGGVRSFHVMPRLYL